MNPIHQRLEALINKATSETLAKPDSQLNQAVCEMIKSKTDMPKASIPFFIARLRKKNGKVIMLTLELLEMASFACGLPFHTQISTKDFLRQMGMLLSSKEMPADVRIAVI